MKTWTVGTNPLPEFKIGTVYLEEVPWFYLALDHVTDAICGFLHKIKLPSWPSWYSKEIEERTNPKDYWGDVGSWFMIKVYNPVVQLRHNKTKYIEIPLGYDRAKELLSKELPWAFKEDEELIQAE